MGGWTGGQYTPVVSTADVCSESHNKLSNGAERETSQGSGGRCDNTASGGWSPNTWTSFGEWMIPLSSPGEDRCGTSITGWLDGSNPSPADGVVSRTMCYHWDGDSCEWSNSIQVVNCGGFYMYKISSWVPECDAGFCTTLAKGLPTAGECQCMREGTPVHACSSVPASLAVRIASLCLVLSVWQQ